jgi:hypothetical protein
VALETKFVSNNGISVVRKSKQKAEANSLSVVRNSKQKAEANL